MRGTLGDRRGLARLEVVGALWGRLNIGKAVRVVNIGQGGALIESSVPVFVNTAETLDLTINGKHVRIEALVRHVEPLAGQGPGEGYQIGLEFLQIPAAFTFD